MLELDADETEMIQGKQRHWVTFLRIQEFTEFGGAVGFIFLNLFFGISFSGIYFYYSGAIPDPLPPFGDQTLAVRRAPG